MKDKLILIDCDGVVLDWEWSFDIWMAKHGYVKSTSGSYGMEITYNIPYQDADRLINMFNESVHIRKLPPFKQSIHYVKKLHEEHGYVFHAITKVGDDPDVVEARNHNLKTLYGESAIHRLTCLNPYTSKREALSEYKDSGCWWIEDHPENVALGYELGLNCLMLDHHYNQDYNAHFPYADKIQNVRVYDWKHIYEKITNGE